jgi:anti-sigma factor RsiW
MNKKEARDLFMDYLYGELDDMKQHELEAFLAEHPDLRDELEELQETRSMIRNIPLEEPAHRLLVVSSGRGRFKAWCRDAKDVLLPQTATGRTSLAIAAILMIAFLVASLARVQITATDGNWVIVFGSGQADVEQGIDEVMLNEFMSRMREENLILVSTLMEETQQQNEAQLIEAVSVILEYMEAQRRQDLRLVGIGLAEIEEENYHRYIQTNETLGELLYTIHQQQ